MAAANKANEVKINEAAIAQAAQVKPFAIELAKADAAYEMVIPKIAGDVARMLGTSPTYDVWNETAKAFWDAYVTQKKCEIKTAHNRWYAIVSYMEGNFEMKKPSAPTVAAEKKSAERAKFDKQVKAAKAKFVKPAEALQAAEVLAKEGKAAEAKVVAAAAQELQKAMIEDARKQNKERVTKIKDLLKAELAKCADVERMTAALEILKYGKDVVKAADKSAKRVPANKAPAKV